VVRPPHRLLAGLAATTLVVTAALCWAGWRLLDQQRTIDTQRQREQVENRADAIAAGIRGRLAETGERLAGWLSDPVTPFQPLENAVLVAIDAGTVTTVPRSALPYLPVTPRSPATPDVFSKIEMIEFGTPSNDEVAERYRALTRNTDPHVRAGALLRLGRVLRRSKDFGGALIAYRELALSNSEWIEGMPAELAGLEGQRATLLAMGDRENARRVSSQLVEHLDRGRWPIARGLAEFHRDELGMAGRPDSWHLAQGLHDTVREWEGRLPGRGQQAVKTDRGAVLVLWRSTGDRTALLAAFADKFFGTPASDGLAWRLVDAGGEVIAGTPTAPLQSAVRILGSSEYPWTVHTWSTASRPLGHTGNSRTILLAMMTAMLVFVWGASYFIARAIRREAEVARLQSDFVAAVSHEFRSPLTTVRQMAEMLETDRLPSEERRRRYYGVIASEAARLQRLVETLLNFGRMEAGAAHYHFAGVDAAALVRNVIHEIEPQVRDRHIEASGPDSEIRMRGDAGALALALRNLIDNAIKYSPNDSTVQVQWKRENNHAAICVIDRGVGIPRAEQRAIFRKFVRGRSAIDANIKGTGVGLSMVQEIALAHGGEIRLDSEIQRGSAFTLVIPLAMADLKVGTTNRDAGASS
jgi:signal transduction histidine kinase